MNNQHHPSGRQPPKIYRRRRIVFGIIALIVAILIIVGITTIVRGVAGLFDSDPDSTAAAASPTPSQTSTPTTTPTSSPSPSPTRTKKPKCKSDDVKVIASVDSKTYGKDEKPELTLTVKNVSDSACRLDVGTKQLQFDITSGEDRIWSSRDCQDFSQHPDAKVNKITFKPGEKKSATMTWDRIRSAKGCKSDLADAKPGTYDLVTKVGSITSKETHFTLK